MNNRNNHLALTAGLAGVIFLSIAAPSCEAQAGSSSSDLDRDMLKQVQTLYGLDESQAIERLASEEIAAETYQAIKSLGLKSYAGAWFDDETLSLHVAISDVRDSKWVERLGANIVPVAYSLDELEAARERAYAVLRKWLDSHQSIRESYIDYRSNQVVIGVAPVQVGRAQSALAAAGLAPGMFRIMDSSGEFELSSGNVRGANGIRNRTYEQQCSNISVHPCSIGASVEGGFITAGHCGSTQHQIRTPSGQILGQVAGSSVQITCDYYFWNDGLDAAWVQTTSGWTPTPQINGYTEGVFSLPARWAGMLEAPVGTTICRYGQTSGGPHCGKILEKNFNLVGGTGLQNLWRAEGKICTQDGDSGGPYMTASGRQMQGTNIGGVGASNCSGSQPPGSYVVIQPVWTTLNYFGAGSSWLTLLTTHGAVKPTIFGANCWATGWGTYSCSFDYYHSQGKTEAIWYSWDSSNNPPHEGRDLYGYCYPPGDQANVQLDVTNPYGTSSWSTSFVCPFGP